MHKYDRIKVLGAGAFGQARQTPSHTFSRRSSPARAPPRARGENRGEGRALTSPRAAGLIGAAGVAYHLEYSLNFSFVRLVPPLAFSVADVARRLAVILAGALIFRKALSTLNCVGVALSLGGVLAFLAASADAPPPKRRRQPGLSR